MGAIKNDLTPFGLWIKTRLLERNMTQSDLAEAVGVRKSYITKIVRGEVITSKYNDDIINILSTDDEEKIQARKLLIA